MERVGVYPVTGEGWRRIYALYYNPIDGGYYAQAVAFYDGPNFRATPTVIEEERQAKRALKAAHAAQRGETA